MSTKTLKLPGTGEVSNFAWAIIFAVALIAVLAIIAGPAFAGADTTFDLAFNKFVGFLEGSGGKIIALLALAGGLIGMAAGGFRLSQVALPVGIGVGIGVGVPIVTSPITALI